MLCMVNSFLGLALSRISPQNQWIVLRRQSFRIAGQFLELDLRVTESAAARIQFLKKSESWLRFQFWNRFYPIPMWICPSLLFIQHANYWSNFLSSSRFQEFRLFNFFENRIHRRRFDCPLKTLEPLICKATGLTCRTHFVSTLPIRRC